MRLLLRAGEMHDADHLVRRIRLDKQAALGVKHRCCVARHPIAIGRQKVDRQVLGKNRVIERGLLDKEKSGALRYLFDDPAPHLPMRSVAAQRKDAAIDHRVASQPVGNAPTERLAVIFPRQGQAKQFRALVVALIGAVDLRDDGELAAARSRDVKLDDTPVLHPCVGIDPQIRLVAGKVARQKRAGELCFADLGSACPARKIDIPAGTHEVGYPLGEPLTLARIETDIENADRDLAALLANRQHHVAQQLEISAVGAADDQQTG